MAFTATSTNLKELAVLKTAGYSVTLFPKAGRRPVIIGEYPDTPETRLLLERYHGRQVIAEVPLRDYVQAFSELSLESKRLVMEGF